MMEVNLLESSRTTKLAVENWTLRNIIVSKDDDHAKLLSHMKILKETLLKTISLNHESTLRQQSKDRQIHELQEEVVGLKNRVNVCKGDERILRSSLNKWRERCNSIQNDLNRTKTTYEEAKYKYDVGVVELETKEKLISCEKLDLLNERDLILAELSLKSEKISELEQKNMILQDHLREAKEECEEWRLSATRKDIVYIEKYELETQITALKEERDTLRETNQNLEMMLKQQQESVLDIERKMEYILAFALKNGIEYRLGSH